MLQGGFGMEVGGSYAGFSASVAMDFDKFKQSSTFSQNYGSHQYTLQSGSDSLPEPISLKLKTIDLALDPIYWQRYDELVASGICASDDQQHLQTRKSNLERALTEYAAYKMAPTPSGNKQMNHDSFESNPHISKKGIRVFPLMGQTKLKRKKELTYISIKYLGVFQ